MTKEERLEHSRLRAEEHQRRERIRFTILMVATALYVVVPVLWYGAIEFGLAHPIRTPEFINALTTARLIILLVALYLLPEFMKKWLRRDEEPKEQAKPSQPTTA